MNKADRLEWLKNEHSRLDKQIYLMEKAYTDQRKVITLKKTKLKIKDEIQQLQEENNEQNF